MDILISPPLKFPAFRAIKVVINNITSHKKIVPIDLNPKEALGNVKGNIGVEFDHMNIQTQRWGNVTKNVVRKHS